MTSERRRQANQRNPQASTGPRSASGKARAAQNARSRSLTVSSSRHPEWPERVMALARNLASPDETDPVRLEAAFQAAAAHFDAVRARLVPIDMIAQFWAALEWPSLPRSAGSVEALAQILGVDLRGVVESLEPGLPPRRFDRCKADVAKSADRVFRIRTRQLATPESWLIKAQRLTRYQRRAHSRGTRTLRQLGETAL